VSLPRFVELACPTCQTEQKCTIWSSVNANTDPELKEQLLNGTLNLFTCAKCGNSAMVNAPLLYHDMQEAFWVQYHPFDWLGEENLLEEFSAEGEIAGDKSLSGRRYIDRPPHLVLGMDELVRYVEFRDLLYAAQHPVAPR